MRKQPDLGAPQGSLQNDQTPHDDFSARTGNYEIIYTASHRGYTDPPLSYKRQYIGEQSLIPSCRTAGQKLWVAVRQLSLDLAFRLDVAFLTKGYKVQQYCRILRITPSHRWSDQPADQSTVQILEYLMIQFDSI